MLPVRLAAALRDAGLRWVPTAGDRFVVADRDMDEQVFVLSELTVEVHQYPSGPVIGFNGTTEWALDSLAQDEALWLPAEQQLRELLGAAFRRLERAGEGYVVVLQEPGSPAGESRTPGRDPAEAYGRALLGRLGGSAAPTS